MSSLGEIKGGFDLLARGWNWFRDRRDPVRVQSQRLIDAFEAHGVARQQIARVLSSELAIPPAAFSSADKLRDKITPALLDWAANYLNLERRWLDGLDAHPHRHVEGYKNEAVYANWLRQRLEREPVVNRRLCIWASSDPNAESGTSGYLSLVYVEEHAWLDNQELSRYWLLSDQWPLDHAPCIVSMLKVVDIARAMGVVVVGRQVPGKTLKGLENGSLFAPQVSARVGKIWYPADIASAITVTDKA
jgi:hypothetical protein